jgi:hypothetical protein
MRFPLAPLALAGLASGGRVCAQPVEVPLQARLGPAPEAPGTGAPVLAVLAFFSGFPSDLRDARDLLDGRSTVPAFHAWCGLLPYVDFTNGQVLDSMGRQSPTVLCLPFLNPARQGAPHSCRAVTGFPTGRYHQGGGLALRIEGGLALRRAGTYTFAWGHDDGVGFAFADRTVFEYRDPTGSRVDRRVLQVTAPGLYLFTLEWFDTIGGALLDWYIADGDASEGPFDTRFRLVDTDDLYVAGSIPCTSDCTRCPAETPRCDWSRGRCVACLHDADCGACARCDDGRCAATRCGDAGGGGGDGAARSDTGGDGADGTVRSDTGGDGAEVAARSEAPGARGCTCVAGGSLRQTMATVCAVCTSMLARRRGRRLRR